MPRFSYKAIKRDGEVQEGEMEAADEAALVRRLQEDGLIPVRTGRAGAGLGGLGRIGRGRRETRLGQQEVALFTRELATLLEAGMPLDRSLQILLELAEGTRTGPLVERVLEEVRGGAALSAALEAQGGVFSRLYVNMVRAGEAGGALQGVLARLADHMERSQELRDSIKSALVYPTILLVVAALSVALLLAFVVPQFAQLFADMGEALPMPTRVVIAAGDLVRDYWWALLLGILAVLTLGRYWLEQPAVRRRWDRRVLRLPLVGDLVTKVQTAHFSRTLATLMENGVPLLSAVGLVREVLTNSRVAESLDAAGEELKRGRGLAEPLTEEAVFPRLALQMLKVGEESGRLEEMLERIANIYDREVRSTVQRLLTLLEPILIVGLGVIVAGIIMSILVAILSVNQMAF